MGKLKELIIHERESIGQVIRRYLGTLILVFLICGYAIFLDIAHIMVGRNEEYLLIFLGMSLVGVFFTETCLRGKKSKEVFITAYILSGIIAFLWVILDVIRFTNDSAVVEYYYSTIAVFYVLCLVGHSLIVLVRDSGLHFEQYALRMLFSLFRVGLILLALNLGFLLLLYLFSTLIVKIDVGDWILRLELLLTALVYVPYILACLTNRTEEKPGKFVRGLVLYGLMPIYMGAVVIVYIYMIRILVTWDFPTNQIFLISAGLFSIGVVIWTMSYAFTRRNPIGLYSILIKYMKYIVAPFIILELYALIVRVEAYGWTIPRYLGFYFILLQVIYTAWDPLYRLFRLIMKNPDKPQYGDGYEGMIYVILAAFFFGIIFPYTCAEYVESNSQEKRFEKIVSEIKEIRALDRSWTPEEYQNIARLQHEGNSVRRVLERNIYGEIFLKTNYQDARLDQMFAMPDVPYTSDSTLTYDEWSYSTYYNSGYPTGHISVPINEYSYFYQATSYYSYNEILSMEDLTKVKLSYGMNEAIRVDLSEVVRNMTETEEGKMMDPTELYTVHFSEGLLLITDISYRYNDRGKQVRELQLDGYLFLN